MGLCETDKYSNYCTCIKKYFFNLERISEYEVMNKTIDTTLTENIYYLFFYCYYCQLPSLLYTNVALRPN